MAHTGTAQPTGEESTIDFNLFGSAFVEPTANILMETCRSKLNNLPQPHEQVAESILGMGCNTCISCQHFLKNLPTGP